MGSIEGVLTGTDRWHVQQGDSLALLAALPAACVDAIITDPPYSSGGQFRGDRAQMSTSEKYTQTGTQIVRPEFAGDNRDQRGYAFWCSLWLAECLRVAKPGAPICLFTDWRQLPTTTDALQAGGWVWRGIVPWDKTEACRPSMGRFAAQCEYVVWGSAGPMPDREDVGCLWGVVRHAVKQADKHHITGKPTEVMRHLVRVCPPPPRGVGPVLRKRHDARGRAARGASGTRLRTDGGVLRDRARAVRGGSGERVARSVPRRASADVRRERVIA